MILKALSKLGIQKIFLNLLKNVCKSPIINSLFPVWEKGSKPIEHIILMVILKHIFLTLKMGQRYPLSISSGQCTGSPCYGNKTKKWNGRYKIDKEKDTIFSWECDYVHWEPKRLYIWIEINDFVKKIKALKYYLFKNQHPIDTKVV